MGRPGGVERTGENVLRLGGRRDMEMQSGGKRRRNGNTERPLSNKERVYRQGFSIKGEGG